MDKSLIFSGEENYVTLSEISISTNKENISDSVEIPSKMTAEFDLHALEISGNDEAKSVLGKILNGDEGDDPMEYTNTEEINYKLTKKPIARSSKRKLAYFCSDISKITHLQQHNEDNCQLPNH